MKKAIFLLLFLCLLFATTSCQSNQEELYSQAASQENSSKPGVIQSMPDGQASSPTRLGDAPLESIAPLAPVPGDTLSGELTVKTYLWHGDPPSIYLLAREFMELHPNTKINFDYDLDVYTNFNLTQTEKEQRQTNYYTRLRTELASGNSDYVLYNGSEQLDLYQLSKNGILIDLRKYWENDSDIHTEDYFTKVLKAFESDGKMTVIPCSFLFEGAFLNRAVLEGLGVDPKDYFALNSDQILDWYEKARETDPELQLLFTAPGKDVLFQNERFRFLDLDAGTASFNSPEFVRFLERTNKVINDDPELDPEKEIGRGYGGMANERLRFQATGKEPVTVIKADPPYDIMYNIATKGRISLATVEEMNLYQLVNFQQPMEYMAGPFPLTSTDGKLALTSQEDFAVPTGCKNPDLAWEFIKYCISERDEATFARYGLYKDTYTNDIPLNKKNFASKAENVPEELKSGYAPGYSEFDPVDGAQLTEILDQIFTLHPVNRKQYGVDVQEYLDEFYLESLTTAEQCAKKIQGRAEIFLNE